MEVPHALESKYPKVGYTWAWFWMFPSPTLSINPRSGVERRHHLFEERLQRALKKAVAQAVNSKYAAKLKFLADESFDEGSHIDTLLRAPKVAQDLGKDEPNVT